MTTSSGATVHAGSWRPRDCFKRETMLVSLLLDFNTVSNASRGIQGVSGLAKCDARIDSARMLQVDMNAKTSARVSPSFHGFV